ncbi:unnamed protein product [Linum tenue]|uniref:B box-type domain-containing protein n=1 Tax=Linum tenue TaxID=586396 RepID=A0AAV0JEN5_9ROSI|nr:unnamed protein product [Linum tenue]
MVDRAKICELCAGAPDVYCNSDDAFLCFNCDARVHQANFLVSRHLRLLLCRTCRCLTQNSVFGPRSLPHSAACASCSSSEVESVSSEQEMDSISCCSSSNPSESGSSTAKFPIRCGETPRSGACEGKIGAVFANWCRKVGVEADLVEPRAVQAMGLLSAGRIGRVLPLRLSLAAAFWFGARLSGDRSRYFFFLLGGLSLVLGRVGLMVGLVYDMAGETDVAGRV